MSISRSLSTISQYSFFGALVGGGFGLHSELTTPRSGNYDFAGTTTFILAGAGAGLGAAIGFVLAVTDFCKGQPKESRNHLTR